MQLSKVIQNRIRDIYITNGIKHETLDYGDGYMWTFKDPLTGYHFRFIVEKSGVFIEKGYRDCDLLDRINTAVNTLLEDRELAFDGGENDCDTVSEYARRDGCV